MAPVPVAHRAGWRSESERTWDHDCHRKNTWYSQTGREQLFDLDEDPQELRNLATVAGPELARWRSRMVDVLRDRPEGFVRDWDLVTGRPHDLCISDYDPTKLYPHV